MSKKIIPLSNELKASTSPYDIVKKVTETSSGGSFLSCEHQGNAPGQKVNKTLSKLNKSVNKMDKGEVCSSGTAKRPTADDLSSSTTNKKVFNAIGRTGSEVKFNDKNELKFLRPKVNETDKFADYDKDGNVVKLELLNVSNDEGQQGTTPGQVLMAKNLMKSVGFDMNVVINESGNEESQYDPRMMEENFKEGGNQIKVYKVGRKFYARTDGCGRMEECGTNYPKNFKLNNEKLCLIGRERLRPITCGLGKSYGIQVGSIHIGDESFCSDVRGKQALDVICVAFGFTSVKSSVEWNEHDIDMILNIGTELYKATNQKTAAKVEDFSEITKGLILRDKFIEVTISEPILIGKISSDNERSMNSFSALTIFFKHHKSGIFQSNSLDLYIEMKNSAFLVFDPRGRSMDCISNSCCEAALMVFQSIDNLHHLITKLSNLKNSDDFKISSIALANVIESKYAPEKFSLIEKKKCRVAEFQSHINRISTLRGNLHLYSKIFEQLGGRQHLTTSIMSIIYAKIDPPHTWSSEILDRVLHFGKEFYLDCIGNGPLSELKLIDIPSKFYIGKAYRVSIAMFPFIKSIEIKKPATTRQLFCDDEITKAIKSAFDLSFRSLLLHMDNLSFSIWRTASALGNEFYFFYDGYRKDSMGTSKRSDNSAAMLHMFVSADDLCKKVVERISKISRSSSSKLSVHGLKIIELFNIKNQQKQHSMPKLVLRKSQSVCPLTASCVGMFADSPSKTDSIVPLITPSQYLEMREEKPDYLTSTDLNSKSLVCGEKCQSFVEEENSTTTNVLVRDVYEDIMKRATAETLEHDEESLAVTVAAMDEEEEEGKKFTKLTCDRFVTCAEKVLLKTDLRCLQRERDDVIQNFSCFVDPYQVLAEAKETRDDITSNFRQLPDKSAIVRGTQTLIDSEFAIQNIFTVENLSVITAISALITSSFHSIETWSCDTVNYVIRCALCMSNFIELKNRFDFSTIVEHKMPKIQIDNRLLNVKMVAIANGVWNDFEKTLSHLISSDRKSFIVVTSHGSLAIFSRAKFYYFFEYATCNFLGYRLHRTGSGSGTDDDASCCMLRFHNLHSLVKRIFANHPEMQRQQKFLICRVMVEEIEGERADDEVAFVPFTKSEEKEIVEKTLEAAMTKLKERLLPINVKIQLEKDRIKTYYDETGQKMEFNLIGNEEEDEDEDDIEFNIINDFKLRIQKHDNDDDDEKFHVTSPFYQRTYDNDIGLGYSVIRCRPMIIGSYAYCDRMTSDDGKLRPCHFACVFALLFINHHPVETMNSLCVDIILENGMRIYENVGIDEYRRSWKLSNIIVDRFKYDDVQIAKFQIRKLSNVGLLKALLKRENHAIVNGKNCSILLYKSTSSNDFHIFDCYDMNETLESSSKLNSNSNALAAFLKFENLDDAICYIEKRVCPSFVTRFVRNFNRKKIKEMETTGYFVLSNDTGYLNSDMDEGSCKYAEHSADEKIDWIYGTKTIPWRYTTSICDMKKKWKEYHVVIDNKLFLLWGNIHPSMEMFKKYAGKQYLACSVLALVMAQLYDINEWDDVLLDSIVAHGHKYHIETVSKITQKNHHMKVDELSRVCCIEDIKFQIKTEAIAYGVLYETNESFMNLNRTLDFMFRVKKLSGVILQCDGKFLAIGNVNNRDYFIFDCQSQGYPLFKPRQGFAYVLKCCCMKMLVACIVLTLNIRRRNVKFYMYDVQAKLSNEKCDESYGNEGNSSQQEGDGGW